MKQKKNLFLWIILMSMCAVAWPSELVKRKILWLQANFEAKIANPYTFFQLDEDKPSRDMLTYSYENKEKYWGSEIYLLREEFSAEMDKQLISDFEKQIKEKMEQARQRVMQDIGLSMIPLEFEKFKKSFYLLKNDDPYKFLGVDSEDQNLKDSLNDAVESKKIDWQIKLERRFK